jgi:gliding motility-associated-like protein
MFQKTFTLLFFTFIYLQTNAQKEANVWIGWSAGGYNVGIDFNSNPPINISTSIYVACNSICNKNSGQLEFSSINTLSDKNFNPIPSPNITFTQYGGVSSIFIPNPADTNQYFLIIDSFDNNITHIAYPNYTWRTNYSYWVIDKSLNGGLGDYIPNSFQKDFGANKTSKIAALKHCGGYWIMLQGFNSDSFYLYKVNNNGFNITPIISVIPNSQRRGYPYEIFSAQMRFASNGQKAVNCINGSGYFSGTELDSGHVQVMNFDKNTGALSLFFDDTIIQPMGANFSPDNSKLYVTGQYGLYQYNMNLPTAATIKASKILIHQNSLTGNLIVSSPRFLQGAANGKIYAVTFNDSVSVINNPNVLGVGCAYQKFSGLLYGDSNMVHLTPNFVENFFTQVSDYAHLYYYNCRGLDSIGMQSFKITATSDYFWQFGDANSGINNTSTLPNPTHIFSDTGIYQIQLIVGGLECGYDTLYKTVIVDSIAKIIISPNVINTCRPIDSFAINTIGAVNYKWLPNINISCDTCASFSMKPTVNTIYTVVGKSANGCSSSKTIAYNIKPLQTTISSNDSICESTPLNANHTSTGAGINWQWICGDGNVVYNINPLNHTYAAGVYTLTFVISDTLGCIDSINKNVFVEKLEKSNFWVSDSTICLGTPIFVYDSLLGNRSYSYNFDDGSYSSKLGFQSHLYDQAQTYNLQQSISYAICLPSTFSIPILVFNYPLVNIGADTSICEGKTAPILLQNSFGTFGTHLWSDSSTNINLMASKPGHYFLMVTDNECQTTDSITIKKSCFLDIPNAFSPNSDGINNYFMPLKELSDGINQYSLKIYNRWGEIVFATTNVNSLGWDGKFGGKAQPLGVFIYQIEVSFNNGGFEKYTGNLTLIR